MLAIKRIRNHDKYTRMINALLDWIGKGQVNGLKADEMAMHTRYTHYFAAGIAVCLALLWVQYKEVSKQDVK